MVKPQRKPQTFGINFTNKQLQQATPPYNPPKNDITLANH